MAVFVTQVSSCINHIKLWKFENGQLTLGGSGFVAMGYRVGLHEHACIILRPIGADVVCFVFLEPASKVVDETPGVNWFVLVMLGDDASVLLRERGLVAMGYLGGLHELACINPIRCHWWEKYTQFSINIRRALTLQLVDGLCNNVSQANLIPREEHHRHFIGVTGF